MAVIQMLDDQVYENGAYRPIRDDEWPEGAYCPFGPGSYNHPLPKHPVILARVFKGLCLFKLERNGYDDSDFFMTVWDPEKKEPFEIMFATTRGWSYPCMGSSPDATPDVMLQYEEWKRERDRRNDIQRRWDLRRQEIEDAKKCRVSRRDVRRIKSAYPYAAEEMWCGFRALLKVHNYRSTFRKSLAEQVRKWLEDPEPKYPTPLSRKQAQYL